MNAIKVVNAALLLCEQPDSIPIQENMATLEKLWLDRIKVNHVHYYILSAGINKSIWNK